MVILVWSWNRGVGGAERPQKENCPGTPWLWKPGADDSRHVNSDRCRGNKRKKRLWRTICLGKLWLSLRALEKCTYAVTSVPVRYLFCRFLKRRPVSSYEELWFCTRAVLLFEHTFIEFPAVVFYLCMVSSRQRKVPKAYVRFCYNRIKWTDFEIRQIRIQNICRLIWQIDKNERVDEIQNWVYLIFVCLVADCRGIVRSDFNLYILNISGNPINILNLSNTNEVPFQVDTVTFSQLKKRMF